MKKRGFTIVEVLIAMGMIGFVAAGLWSLINGSLRGQKNVQNAVDFDILKSSVQHLLNSPSKCKDAFYVSGGLKVLLNPGAIPTPAAPLALAEIRVGASRIIDMANPQLGGGAKVKKLQFIEASPEGLPVGGFQTYLVNLFLEIEKAAGAPGRKTLSQNFIFSVKADAGGSIVECAAPAAPQVPPANTTEICSGGRCFFMDNNASPNKLEYQDAIKACRARSMSLCSSDQWLNACLDEPETINDMNFNYSGGPQGPILKQWVLSPAGFNPQYVNVDDNSAENCIAGDRTVDSADFNYRCCRWK